MPRARSCCLETSASVPVTDVGTVVFLVDDDPAIRKALPRALENRGYVVEVFASAEEFLDTYETQRSGCLVLDLSMPEMDGLQLQEHLGKIAPDLPIIFITGHGNIPQSVQALRAGALDFIEKPFRQETLLERIDEAFASQKVRNDLKMDPSAIRERAVRLTDREVEVLRLLAKANSKLSNKEIARELEISHRTVEHHRARAMEKLDATDLTELAEIAKLLRW